METENKAVLISVKPKWCELIANRYKTMDEDDIISKMTEAFLEKFQMYFEESE